MVRKLKLSEKHLKFLRVKGESMQPTIVDGALLLLDTRDEGHKFPRVRSGPARRTMAPSIYVFHQRGMGYRVKRIERIDENAAFLISDNLAEHPPEMVSVNEGVTIIGRVAWWDNVL